MKLTQFLLWGVELGSHCLRPTNRGLSVPQELFYNRSIMIIYSTCRQRHGGKNRFIWAGADTGYSRRKDDVTSNEEKQRHVSRFGVRTPST